MQVRKTSVLLLGIALVYQVNERACCSLDVFELFPCLCVPSTSPAVAHTLSNLKRRKQERIRNYERRHRTLLSINRSPLLGSTRKPIGEMPSATTSHLHTSTNDVSNALLIYSLRMVERNDCKVLHLLQLQSLAAKPLPTNLTFPFSEKHDLHAPRGMRAKLDLGKTRAFYTRLVAMAAH